mgnify:CR=1 FL=1
MGVAYRWNGQRNTGEQRGWQEWFPGRQGLPPRDLTDDDVAALTDEQRGLLASPAGVRLYSPVEPEPPASPHPKRSGKALNLTETGA